MQQNFAVFHQRSRCLTSLKASLEKSSPSQICSQPAFAVFHSLSSILCCFVIEGSDIILSVASVHNSAEELAYYELEGLGENQLALTFTCMPEISDWRMMLRELLSTARNDDLLMDVLVRAAEISAQNPSQQELLLQFGVKHLEDLRPALQKVLDEAIENVNSYAESLYGTAFEIAAGSGLCCKALPSGWDGLWV